MHVITARNVTEALQRASEYLSERGESEPSRDGPVIVAPEPVTTVYTRPWERVLLWPQRDANPFFHLLESVWILAGRRDATFLDRYVKSFSTRFAEDGGLQHGAYGYRWRSHFFRNVHKMNMDGYEVDQFKEIADMLRKDPTSRRAVMTMWDPVVDLNLPSRDLPCNTHVYFRARPVSDLGVSDSTAGHRLDITVLCRSNDMVMGAYGANAVHMSIMGEVIAGLAGMRLGTYRQVSNNFHLYERDLGKVPTSPIDQPYNRLDWNVQPICGTDDAPDYLQAEAKRVLMDASVFCDVVAQDSDVAFDTLSEYAQSEWFRQTVIPMQKAHTLWKRGGANRMMAIGELVSTMPARSDWARAGVEWMERRIK